MNVFADITNLIALVKAGSYWSAFLLLAKIVAEIGALFPTPAPTPVIPTEVSKHMKTKATNPVALCAEIEKEAATNAAAGAPSGALLALLLKLAPLLLALLGL